MVPLPAVACRRIPPVAVTAAKTVSPGTREPATLPDNRNVGANVVTVRQRSVAAVHAAAASGAGTPGPAGGTNIFAAQALVMSAIRARTAVCVWRGNFLIPEST